MYTIKCFVYFLPISSINLLLFWRGGDTVSCLFLPFALPDSLFVSTLRCLTVYVPEQKKISKWTHHYLSKTFHSRFCFILYLLIPPPPPTTSVSHPSAQSGSTPSRIFEITSFYLPLNRSALDYSAHQQTPTLASRK